MAAKKDSGNGNDFHDRGDDVRDGDDNESLLEHGDGIPESKTEPDGCSGTESKNSLIVWFRYVESPESYDTPGMG
jgi:hypothetical protein